MPSFSLAALTALELALPDLIDVAAARGYQPFVSTCLVKMRMTAPLTGGPES